MILVKIPGIKGQTAVSGHEDWLPMTGITWGASRGIAEATGGRNKREPGTAQMSEVSFVRHTDMASPHLFFQACGGKQLDPVEIELLQVVDNKPQTFVKIKLEDGLISGYNVQSDGKDTTETISINYVKLTYQYDTWVKNTLSPGNPRSWNQAELVGA